MRSLYNDELSRLEQGGWNDRVWDESAHNWVSDKTRAQLLEEYKERTNRLNAISGVYQRADRIITGQDITVTVVHDPTMPSQASSTGKAITFNASLIDNLDDDSILSLHGLNYHEVAHVLYSPRAGSELARNIRDNKLKRAFFILEEARAENMLVTKYPITRLFLEASVMRYLLDKADNIGGYFHLITGRKYLPLEIRQAVADKAMQEFDPDMIRDMHNLIHEYRTLVFPRDYDKAKELCLRLSKWVGLDDEPHTDFAPTDHGDMIREGRPANTNEQDKLQGRDKAKNEPTESLDNPTKIEDGNGEGKAKDVLMDDEQKVTFNDIDENLIKAINERMKDIKQDQFIKRELSDTRKAILGSDEARISIKGTEYATHIVEPTAQTIARRFSQELQELVLDQDPAWDRAKPYGKLIPSRTMNPDINNIGRVFDRWNIGNDETDIEAVILLDNSSSMHGLMNSVCENAWIIKRAIESINGKVTTFSFNHESKLLYEGDERAKASEYRFVYATGNTNPLRALVESERLLATSKRHIKLLFVVTDGEWNFSDECDSLIASMNDSGVLTTVVYLEQPDSLTAITEYLNSPDPELREFWTGRMKMLSHGAKVFKAVGQTRDVLTVATSLVRELVGHGRVA